MWAIVNLCTEPQHDEGGPCSAITKAERIENVGGEGGKNVEKNRRVGRVRGKIIRNFKSLITWISGGG